MNKKSQVLIISLWVLLMLTILAVSIGHRVSLALRVSGYQRDALKAVYLARAGINLAGTELQKDQNQYDGLDEVWSTGLDPVSKKPLFESLEIEKGSGETFTVGYPYDEEQYLCMMDEERKININTATKDVLVVLLQEFSVTEAEALVDNIRAWRGDQGTIPEDAKDYSGLGYDCKEEAFVNIAELALVKDLPLSFCKAVQGLITIYGDGKLNINTVSEDALNIFCRGIARSLSVKEEFADTLTAKIIAARNQDGPFKVESDIASRISPTGDEEINILNGLKPNLVIKSNNFLIQAKGSVGRATKRLAVVVEKRVPLKIVYWQQY